MKRTRMLMIAALFCLPAAGTASAPDYFEKWGKLASSLISAAAEIFGV